MRVSRGQLRQIIRETFAGPSSTRTIQDVDTNQRHTLEVGETGRKTVRLRVSNSLTIEMSPEDAEWLGNKMLEMAEEAWLSEY